jgi:hypothetical protein
MRQCVTSDPCNAERAAASAAAGDGGAWLAGEMAREIACDAMIIPGGRR